MRPTMSEQPEDASGPGMRTAVKQPVRLDSADLFHHSDRVQIEHRGEVYRLQITRQGKLILTK